MAQQLNRTEVATIIGSAINNVWESAKSVVKPNYPSWVNKKSSPHAKYITYPMAYFGEVPKKGEGTALQYEDFKFGSLLTIDPDSYGFGVRLTREALDDMAQSPYGDFSSAQLISASRIGKGFRQSVEQTKDVLAAQFILSGSSATATAKWQGAGWDSVALAATNHPILANTSILGGTTYSNLPTAASLSQSALYTAITSLETIPTLEGLVRPFAKKYKLVVGPNLRGTAFTVVETAKLNKLAGSTDHDVPSVADFDIQVIVNPFLGSSSTRWAVISEDNGLGYWDRQAAMVDDEKDFETKGHKWSVFFRTKFFHEDSFGFVLNTGA